MPTTDPKPRDGGAAFPLHGTDTLGEPYVISPGMSLRDYFAGQALAAILVNGEYDFDDAASDAYRYANAMLAARSEGEGSDG